MNRKLDVAGLEIAGRNGVRNHFSGAPVDKRENRPLNRDKASVGSVHSPWRFIVGLRISHGNGAVGSVPGSSAFRKRSRQNRRLECCYRECGCIFDLSGREFKIEVPAW